MEAGLAYEGVQPVVNVSTEIGTLDMRRWSRDIDASNGETFKFESLSQQAPTDFWCPYSSQSNRTPGSID